ncbi:MAG: site-specific integrase, partial [Eubacteriales bacterium]
TPATKKSEEKPNPPQKFEPYQGIIRKKGTGCVSQIGEHLWEGRYSPRLPDGKRWSKNVYSKTKMECEEKLSHLIVDMKAEILEQKQSKIVSQ